MMLNKLILLTVTTVVGEALCRLSVQLIRWCPDKNLSLIHKQKLNTHNHNSPTSLIAYHKRNISASSNKCQDKSWIFLESSINLWNEKCICLISDIQIEFSIWILHWSWQTLLPCIHSVLNHHVGWFMLFFH